MRVRRLVRTVYILLGCALLLLIWRFGRPKPRKGLLQNSGGPTPQKDTFHKPQFAQSSQDNVDERNPLQYHVHNAQVLLKQQTSEDQRSSFDYRVLYSVSTMNREYIRVYINMDPVSSVSVIPDPDEIERWILVGQRKRDGQIELSQEVVACSAAIQEDNFLCATPSTLLILSHSIEGICTMDLYDNNVLRGEIDARVFWGPNAPYIVYGALSEYICMGQWIQDLRALLTQFRSTLGIGSGLLKSGMEIMRKSKFQQIEKNYFLFWDSQGGAYVHYHIWPERSFARFDESDHPSDNLAVEAHYHDQICMAKYMPAHPTEVIHQATNSLSITMCKRQDPLCKPKDSNTFIMYMFHFKTLDAVHAIYEPYVMLFHRTAPFEIYAIGQRPFWIHGRHNLTKASDAFEYRDRPESIPLGHTEMFYLTGITWVAHTQRYHGYMDDTMFLSFGIEHSRTGVIDVPASDLLQDLAYC